MKLRPPETPPETAPFGWTNAPVPVIGQGTWRMGQSRAAREEELAALALGVELGMTHIDTAEMYTGAEELVGAAMRRFRRSDLFVVSKVLPSNASYRGTIRAAERTLQRLGMDYLDLYLLHWPGSHPIGETMRAMEDLVRAGTIRFIGVSNFDVSGLHAATAALGRERLACNQVLYHLGARGIERDLIPYCAGQRIAVVGYTPLGGLAQADHASLRILRDVGVRHGASPHQVALRFLTRTPGVFAIPKASQCAHVRENAGATDVCLSDEDLAAIDRAFPAPAGPVPLEMN